MNCLGQRPGLSYAQGSDFSLKTPVYYPVSLPWLNRGSTLPRSSAPRKSQPRISTLTIASVVRDLPRGASSECVRHPVDGLRKAGVPEE